MIFDFLCLLIAWVVLLHFVLVVGLLDFVGLDSFGGFGEVHFVLLSEVDTYKQFSHVVHKYFFHLFVAFELFCHHCYTVRFITHRLCGFVNLSDCVDNWLGKFVLALVVSPEHEL